MRLLSSNLQSSQRRRRSKSLKLKRVGTRRKNSSFLKKKLLQLSLFKEDGDNLLKEEMNKKPTSSQNSMSGFILQELQTKTL